MVEKKFRLNQIKTIPGGKDPVIMLSEFILKLGFDPASLEVESNEQRTRWMVPLSETEDVEIILDSVKNPQDATIYIGVNICAVPLKKLTEFVVTALELADGLVGAKISIVGRYLVLSSTVPAYSATIDELEYIYKLVLAQKEWFLGVLSDELDIDTV
ncbi:MAG: YbjN domain-containing protein [Deltaproteobacteria bacterium]|nr:YbjN domain-containing protein [Deltaproteobacteria bacterium]MCX7952880.1 YbjN domain-containing protein [Deltaproteobacteria bacterium]